MLFIKESILDGTYKYCDKNQCPHLNNLLNTGVANFPILKKSTYQAKKIINNYNVNNKTPTSINLNMDRSCNFKCPSCRKEIINNNNNEEEYNIIKTQLEDIEKHFSKNLERIGITGTGDPFFSKPFREFLINFDPKKYPKLENIHLHTNASLWTEKMWNSMPNIHKYVKSCEISIDAATKETYENVVRLNGNWENLLERLEYIKTIKTIKKIRTSFVVQQSNYKEINKFADLIYKILGNKSYIFYIKINNWGTFTHEEYKNAQIWDKNHPEHNIFLEEINNVHYKPFVYHNFHEFINKNIKHTKII
jgi:MoaA/NifB/PqqE/SkfB family radical SAM enzyme